MRKFIFRLALALGRTVRQLLTEIDSKELTEWQVYYGLEPFGDERADYRQAVTSCILANVYRGKNSKEYKITDFMLTKKSNKSEQQNESAMKLMLQAFTESWKLANGNIKKSDS
jgi:hypothetical protein